LGLGLGRSGPKSVIRDTVLTMVRLSSAYKVRHAASTTSWQSYRMALYEDEEIAMRDSIAAAALA
jgi:hypothetical protein